MGQKFAGFDATGAIGAFYDSEDSPVPPGVTDVIEISYEQWVSCLGGGFSVREGVLVPPTPLTAEQLALRADEENWLELRAEAQSALNASDIVVMRCYESAVPVPAEWVAYRKALRGMVGATHGDASQGMPPSPENPPWE